MNCVLANSSSALHVKSNKNTVQIVQNTTVELNKISLF